MGTKKGPSAGSKAQVQAMKHVRTSLSTVTPTESGLARPSQCSSVTLHVRELTDWLRVEPRRHQRQQLVEIAPAQPGPQAGDFDHPAGLALNHSRSNSAGFATWGHATSCAC